MVHIINLGSTIFIITIQLLDCLLHQTDEISSTIMTMLLDCVCQTESSHTRNMRTSHGSTLHITICRLTILNQSRKHSALLFGSLCPILILFFTYLAIIFQVTTRSTQGNERTIVGIAGWRIVGSDRSYTYTLGISTRERRIASILITCSKNRNTTINNTIRRTGIVNEIIQSLLLQRISLSPLLFGSRTRSITIDDT